MSPRFSWSLVLSIILTHAAVAGNYAYHPASVLKLGGTFDPENLTVSYPSCLRYDREYVVHRLGRKDESYEPGTQPPPMHGVPTAIEKPADDLIESVENTTSNTDLSVQQIQTREQLYSFLNISASISGQYKLFSASASGSFESEETFDSENFVFGVRGMTTWGEIGLIEPRLSNDASELKRNRAAFYARCGREWVATETRGVLIAVVYTIKNVSQSQRSRLEAAVSGGFNGAIFKIDASANLEKIFKKAFVSNYYSMRVHAVGGNGVSTFGDSLQKMEEPDEVIKQISAYMKKLKYQQSVPMSFTTGSLDQFLASNDDNFNFDSYNRRIAELFLAYQEYKARRQQIWRFVNDDLQAYWGSNVDNQAWSRLIAYDNALSAIEGTARTCKAAAIYAGSLSARRPLSVSTREDPQEKSGRAQRNESGSRAVNSGLQLNSEEASYLRRFTIGSGQDTKGQSKTVSRSLTVLQRLVAPSAAPPSTGAAGSLGDDQPSTCPEPGPSQLSEAQYSQCECQRYNQGIYVQTRFPILSVPSVEVFHDIDSFKPGSLIFISVTSSAGLESVELFDNRNASRLPLQGGYDPERGPVWYGSLVYRDGQGKPPLPETLPYVLHIKDKLGRDYRKPVVIRD